MNMKRALLYFVLFFQLTSCLGLQDSKQDMEFLDEHSKRLYNELSAIHDTAMLLMSPIAGVKVQLRSHLGSSSAQPDSILMLLTELKNAEDWMMRWMNEFRNVDLDEFFYQTAPKDSIREYLQTEKDQVLRLYNFMGKTLRRAKDFNRSIENF